MMPRLAIPRVWRRVAALAACVIMVFASLVPVLAAPGSADDKFTLTGDRVEYNSQSRIARADGHVQVTGRDAVITADHLEANLASQEIVATGNVTLTRGENKATGTFLRYNLRTRVGRIEQMRGESPPWHVTGDAVDVGPRQDVAYTASITPCDPAHPLYLVTAKKIEIFPDDHFTATDASLWVAGVRVITLPAYTSTLGRPSGPSIGVNSPDGVYLDYTNSFPVGDLIDQYRLRFGSSSGLSASNALSERFRDHLFVMNLGRFQPYDVGGNLVNVDRFSVDLEYDRIKIPGAPVDFQVEAHAGSYGELATGVSTARFEGILNVSTETFRLGDALDLSLSGQYRLDAYGTGQQRTAAGASAALSNPIGDGGRATLSYGFTDLYGTSPFSFDHLDPGNSVTLNYSYSFNAGFLETLSSFLNYDFLQQQYVFNLSLAMRVTANTLFNVTAWYNLTTQQVTEVDFAISHRCDCVTIGLLYRTFPQSPSGNTLMVTVTLNTFPERAVSFSGTGVTYSNP